MDQLKSGGTLCEPSDSEPNIKALKYGFAAMLNEGIDMNNEENSTNNAPLTLRQVGRPISDLGPENVSTELNNVVVGSTQSEEKTA